MATKIAVLIISIAVLGAQSPVATAPVSHAWQSVAKLQAGDVIQVVQTDGQVAEGKFQSISAETLVLETRRQIRSLPLSSVRQVFVRRKGSRRKAAAIGAAVGFAIGFPIGAASAGNLADRNNPSVGDRAKFGAGLGLFIGGSGGGIGALTGGSHYETIYRQR